MSHGLSQRARAGVSPGFHHRARVGVAAGLTLAFIAMASSPALADQARRNEWWLRTLHVTNAWRTTRGSGVTIAVLDTGVNPAQADLTGSVVTGPDYTTSGRTSSGPFWGIHGTEVASLIAGHGHGPGRANGIIGIAPAAKILSVRVTLESNDPLLSNQTIAAGLPNAIAHGIKSGRPARRDRHRPATRPGDRARCGRLGRQPSRAGSRRLRGGQARGTGRPGGRQRHRQRLGELPRCLPRRHLRGRLQPAIRQGAVQQPPAVCDGDRRRGGCHRRRRPGAIRSSTAPVRRVRWSRASSRSSGPSSPH